MLSKTLQQIFAHALSALIGVLYLPTAMECLRNLVSLHMSSTNLPGGPLATIAMAAILPVTALSFWNRKLTGRGLVVVGISGIVGTLSTRCLWFQNNRNFILPILATFATVAVIGRWIEWLAVSADRA